MKTRTKAWIIVVLFGWMYPIWLVAEKFKDWLLNSVDIVEENLKRKIR